MHAYRDQYAQLFNDGQDVVLIAISADPVEELASWARDDQFQFLMASDRGLDAARKYGAMLGRMGLTNRNLYVIGPDGRIAYTATPFREIDPTAYTELAEAIDRVTRTATTAAGGR
ncbi:MAG TPA: redoxin domain-containing protein [Longimicrobiales bacterium]